MGRVRSWSGPDKGDEEEEGFGEVSGVYPVNEPILPKDKWQAEGLDTTAEVTNVPKALGPTPTRVFKGIRTSRKNIDLAQKFYIIFMQSCIHARNTGDDDITIHATATYDNNVRRIHIYNL